MNLISMPAVATMTSREISDLIEKQHSHIKVSAERLSEKGVIGTLAAREFTHNGNTYTEYLFNKRDSLVLVAQNCPEFTARIIDRWQELEEKVAKPQALPQMAAFKMVPDIVRAAKAFGMDKNAAAISANQVVLKLTGTNLLQLMGHTHLLAEKQAILYTPTELGQQFLGGLSARKVNLLLAEAGLQAKKGEHWAPMQAAEDFCRVLDTGKRHGDGTPVVQVKWFDGVVKLVNRADVANA